MTARSKYHRRWTPEEVRRLVAWRSAGMTRREIARRLGVGEDRVTGKLTRLGLRLRPPAGSGRPGRRVRRRCLSCGESFLSDGAHNRQCEECAARPDWP